MKKLFAMIFATVFVFGACAKSETNQKVETGGTGVATQPKNELTIVEDGESDYKIVIPKDATPCEEFAGEELQSFIDQSTGVSLPIVTDDTVRFSKYSSFLSVGQTSLYEDAKFGVNDAKLKLDGFVLKSVGKQVFIRGARDRGTLYGVYDFLEKYLGVRFFSPEVTKVPQNDDLEIPVLNEVEIPAINIRDYYIAESDRNALYTARQRMVALYGADYPEYGGTMYRDMNVYAHNVGTLCDYEIYKYEHADWFYWNGSNTVYDICMSRGLTADGKPDSDYEISPWSVCLQSLKDQIKAYPEISYFSFCQNDIPHGCPCDLCAERSAVNRGGWSGVLLRFVNALSNAIDEWLAVEYPEGREIKIVTFAYAHTKNPPTDEKGNWYVVPNDNVVIWLATSLNYAYSLSDERQQEEFKQNVNAWRAKAKAFMYWDYRVNFREYWWYMPGLTTFQEDIQFLAEMNTEYAFLEAASGWTGDPCTWQGPIKAYIVGKLMWNPKQDVSVLLKEYLEGVYGESASVVKSVIDLFEDNYERLKQNESLRGEFGIDHELGYGTLSSKWYPCSMLESACRLLETEIDRVSNSSMSEKEKTSRLKGLKNMLCTPQKMLLRNYTSYYQNDYEGEVSLAKAFLDNIDFCGLAGFDIGGYNNTYDAFKEQYGL